MYENNTLKFVVYEDEMSNECDSDGLEIDETKFTASPEKSPAKKASMDPKDKEFLENIEEEIERQLDEKAAKTKLSAINVKHILKNIITNEHVLAMVRRTVDNNSNHDDDFNFEPKLTRAKVKELLKMKPDMLVWPTNTEQSEVHVLINQELPEDSSDEEYVPDEDEQMDDDVDMSASSDLDSQPPTPATPASVCSTDCATQTTWSEDGLFKVPKAMENSPKNSEPLENIALRTRSKLSLSDTPLECIEQAFIPPDITTDMYDYNCDNEDWNTFLQELQMPLNQDATAVAEDDEDDPEYNVLADEELDEVDKEELRVDSRVQVPKKELNSLIAELTEYSDSFTPSYTMIDVPADSWKTNGVENKTQNDNRNETTPEEKNETANILESSENETEYIRKDQILLFEQQFRQHVQLATQFYLQTSIHPDYKDTSSQFKKLLVSLMDRAELTGNDYLRPLNLMPSLELIDYWDDKIRTNDVYIHESKIFYERQSELHYKAKRVNNTYEADFPPFLKKTVLESDVFLYPTLLPVTSIAPAAVVSYMEYLPSEDSYIALGLEQFTEYMESNPQLFTLHHKKASLKDVTHLIVCYMMPMKDPISLYRHVRKKRSPGAPENPIQYYFQYKKGPPFIHYVLDVKLDEIVPLIERPCDLLPTKWLLAYKSYKLYGKVDGTIALWNSNCTSTPTKRICKPPSFSGKRKRTSSVKNSPANISSNSTKKTDFKELLVEIPVITFKKTNESLKINNSPKRLLILAESLNHKKNLLSVLNTPNKQSSDIQIEASRRNVLNMPFLTTPQKDSSGKASETILSDLSSSIAMNNSKEEVTLTPENDVENEVTVSENIEKDNEDDINALMLASSTIKNKTVKRTISATEKKKIKQQKEHEATLALLMPDSTATQEEKATKYAQAYFDKVQERLSTDSSEGFQEFLATLSDFDESVGSVSDLYSKVENILSPNHQDLSEEFLTFLTPMQAKQIGKLIPHFMYTNMAVFLRKLEIYFNKQPAQIKKIYNSLTELSMLKAPTIEKIKSCILPLLKGNAVLIDYFLQIFPTEKPPENLMTVWEDVDCDKSNVKEDEEMFESINVPVSEDPYGNATCICACHTSSDEQYSKRLLHCLSCGTKFIHGRVFVQTRKGLRPAGITFDNGSISEHRKRLCVNPTVRSKRRCEPSSPTKAGPISPNKQIHIELDEDDGLLNKGAKSPSKSARSKNRAQPAKRVQPKTKNDRAAKTDNQKKLNDHVNEPGKVNSTQTSESVVQKRASPRFQTASQETLISLEQSSSSKEKPLVGHDKEVTANLSQNVSQPAEESSVNPASQDSVQIATAYNKDSTADVKQTNVKKIIDSLEKSQQKELEFSTVEKSNAEDAASVSRKENTTKEPFEINSKLEIKMESEPENQESDECNTSIESIELKISPDRSVESIDVCEESSEDISVCQDEGQTICSESENESNVAAESNCGSPIQIFSEESSNNDCSATEGHSGENKDSGSGTAVVSRSWTREEDKVILQAFQQHCGSEKIFEKINRLIPQRTVQEIRERFQTLMQLLQQITDSNT